MKIEHYGKEYRVQTQISTFPCTCVMELNEVVGEDHIAPFLCV